MVEVDLTILERLRRMAKKGQSASQMLRKLHDELPANEQSKLTLIRYFRQAFSLSLQEAGPIAGWSAEGTGEISDDRLDSFLQPAIVQYRHQWDEN